MSSLYCWRPTLHGGRKPVLAKVEPVVIGRIEVLHVRRGLRVVQPIAIVNHDGTEPRHALAKTARQVIGARRANGGPGAAR